MRISIRQMANTFLCVLFFLLSGCQEDTVTSVGYGSIVGSIADAETAVKITGVAITTNPATTAIVNDANGEFRLDNVPAGEYTISVQKIGYSNTTIKVAVLEDKTTNATVLLRKSAAIATPPGLPKNPSPSHQVSNQPIGLTLSWNVDKPFPTDSLRFDVYLYASSSSTPQKVATDLRDSMLTIDTLRYNTTYFWQVIVKDTANLTTNGLIWTFTTRAMPDNRIVYTTQSSGSYEVYSADTLGHNILQLTSTPNRNWWPRLSPRLNKIAFSSDVSAQPNVYSINRDGTGRSKITTLPMTGFNNFGIGFCYSPDGGQILYGHNDKLYRIGVDGYNLAPIATAPGNRHFRECDWTSVGNKIVVLTVGANPYENEIYIMNADGSNSTLFITDLPGIIESPSFSVDGKSIMFTHDVSGYESLDGRMMDAHIFLTKVDRTDSVDVSILKPAGTNDTNPRFSPDGSRIIFTNGPNDGSSLKDIWVMNVDGTNRHKIIAGGEMPDWR